MMNFILKTGDDFTPPDEWVESWYRFYNVEYVDKEMRRAAMWTVDNVAKRKTKVGMRRFIGSWLDRNFVETHKMKELT